MRVFLPRIGVWMYARERAKERSVKMEARLAERSDARPEEIVNGVRAAAAGECVLSPCIGQELLAHIRDRGVRVAAGDDWSADAIRAVLTERELEIFTRLASGESNQGIGRAFSLSE